MTNTISNMMNTLGEQAIAAAKGISSATTAVKNDALLAIADAIEASALDLKVANKKDMQAGRDRDLEAALFG